MKARSSLTLVFRSICKFYLFPAVLLLCFSLRDAGAENFSYKHRKGDRYRILSSVHEEVYLNGRFSHEAEILNRITSEVTDESDGKGKHRIFFQTLERAGVATDNSFHWSREYESEFERDRLGRVTIDKKYYMPVVRDVPVFPGRDIKVGEAWSHEGHEVHDFREYFGIRDPYYIPFVANYVFLGDRVWKNKTYPAFSVNYRIQSSPNAVPGRIWPRRIQGASDQIIYWDRDMGQAVAYSEEFQYIFEFSDGRKVEYRGTAEAEVIESVQMDKEKIAQEIADDINRLDIPDVTVRVVDEGITISLDDIQFYPDTAIMLSGEQEKLDKIVEILRHYQERDILVGGHTALAGTAEGRNRLSTERAAGVADYLIQQGVRTPERIIVRGYGADRPLAGNSTEEGRRKNRRVEITILEN